MLGDKIRKIRRSRKISINRLSELTGISLGYLSDLENNKAMNPTMEIIDKIAKALNVTLEDIFKDDEHIKLSEISLHPRLKPIIHSLDRAGDLQDEDVDEIAKQVEFLINLKREKK